MNEKSKIIELPKILDKRGNLSFIEQMNHIPFEIKRVYWVYDECGNGKQGNYAYKTISEFIVALSGSFDVILNDGKKEIKYSLNRPHYGLFIPKMYWRRIENFSTNALSLILASDYYNGQDYINDFQNFKELVNDK